MSTSDAAPRKHGNESPTRQAQSEHSGGASRLRAADLSALGDEALLEALQRQTFGFFWEGAHEPSGLARDRHPYTAARADLVATGGSGFGLMAMLVAVERGWIPRGAALERLTHATQLLARARTHHGALPHFLDGRSGATIPFMPRDDGGDLVETAFLCMGLLCVRQYFVRADAIEAALRERIDALLARVEWDWYGREDRQVLYWHWSPTCGWALEHRIRGWNECLITYVLAAGASRHAIEPELYHRGFASGPEFRNGAHYYGIELPLGPAFGGPLFFAHYSFCGLDPRGLSDRYADYWRQNLHHMRINQQHCIVNPHHFPGYGSDCWGLTASDDPGGYEAHSPTVDNGTLSPTAALSSFPYAPAECLRALRYFLATHGDALWGRFGFVDAFCPARGWYADSFLAIDQGPIIVMIENYRSGLLWRLFMSAPEVQRGLSLLGFQRSPPTEMA
ncbi:MAG TPA: glucoamylase family protein [Steroidobacteraceae bacterium]|nr:glucoamylase family protein [Steroidobacteraceae bacterium]